MKTKKKHGYVWAVIATLVIVVVSLVVWQETKGPTSEDLYEQVKSMLKTPGTRLSTVKLCSKDGRTASGTLVKNGGKEIIITVAHYFSTRNPDTEFWFTLDGVGSPIKAVLPHPKEGPFGPKDIAFCVPGKSEKVRNFWQAKRDETYVNASVGVCTPFDIHLLEGNMGVTVKGTFTQDNKEPIYIIPHVSHDGDSGSGLITRGRFFVIKGNIASSNLDLREILGINQSNITLITEL